MATLNHRRREAVFRALADPTRREILSLLRGRARTVSEMADNFSTSRPAISKHLRILREVGLVETKREGTSRICRLNAEPLRLVEAWLHDHRQLWRRGLRGLKRSVEDEP
jgi:DNA-binding transcriptional ArsR family regulator